MFIQVICKTLQRILNNLWYCQVFPSEVIISHPRVIQSHIANYHITVKFDDVIIGLHTVLLQKLLLQVYVRELHIDMIKKMLLGFLWHTTNKDLSILVILLFDYFFHQNYKIWPSTIKLFVVATYAPILEHIKSG